MCGLLALLFIVVPAVEIFVILQVGGWIGLWPTLALIIVTALAGAWLTQHQGFAAVRQLQESMLTGSRIGTSLIHAALVLAAGVVMLTPGFVTDAIGLFLLIPQGRELVARRLRKSLENRVARGDVMIFPMGRARRPGSRDDDDDGRPPPVIDV